MTRAEQHKLVDELRNHQRKMTREELYDFEMMMKRDRDDEDLDDLTRRRLQDLHKRYLPGKSKRDLDDLWAKMTKKKEQ